MLADEVTHVKMGSDWLRRLTATDPERQKQALDFQKAVDKLFSFGGFRGEQDENPVHLARNFRRLAGFSDDEISRARRHRRRGLRRGAGAGRPLAWRRRAGSHRLLYAQLLLDIHKGWAWFVIIGNGLAGAWALGANWLPALRTRALWWFTIVAELAVFVQVGAGRRAWSPGRSTWPPSSTCSTASWPSSPSGSSTRTACRCATGCTCSTGSAACS